MKLKRMRVKNYKGFKDSKSIEFCDGFNVIVGQNNSGKSALVECLNLNAELNRPYRSSESTPSADRTTASSFEIEVEITQAELCQMAFNLRSQLELPIPFGEAQSTSTKKYWEQFLEKAKFEIALSKGGGPQWQPRPYPSHQAFQAGPRKACAILKPNIKTNEFEFLRISNDDNDNFGAMASRIVSLSSYAFRAERLNVTVSEFGNATNLEPNAANLPTVLNTLQGQNPFLFAKLNDHIKTIFPNISRISVRPFGSDSGKVEILIWMAGVSSSLSELAVPLSECGTGVGQVLALLYVVITANNPKLIAIDEPNSFLHPGATRKLIQTLSSYTNHQYVLSTHSPDVLSFSEPEMVHTTKWNVNRTEVETHTGKDVGKLRGVLADLGVRLSDTFGMDSVLWVEGPTEEQCFPMILRSLERGMPAGMTIVPVIDTGDLETRKLSGQKVFEIYTKLSQTSSLMPTLVGFCLDREGRSEDDLARLERQSNGKIKFLPRRSYENYLINVEAITAILGRRSYFLEHPITPNVIYDWLLAHGGQKKYGADHVWNNDLQNENWLIHVHAPRMLNDLFIELSKTTEEYRKTMHSPELTEWILKNDSDKLQQLKQFLNQFAV